MRLKTEAFDRAKEVAQQEKSPVLDIEHLEAIAAEFMINFS